MFDGWENSNSEIDNWDDEEYKFYFCAIVDEDDDLFFLKLSVNFLKLRFYCGRLLHIFLKFLSWHNVPMNNRDREQTTKFDVVSDFLG